MQPWRLHNGSGSPGLPVQPVAGARTVDDDSIAQLVSAADTSAFDPNDTGGGPVACQVEQLLDHVGVQVPVLMEDLGWPPAAPRFAR